MLHEEIGQLSQIKSQHVENLLSRRNVVACGIGYKVSNGVKTDELSLIVSVTHKVHPSALTLDDLIPREVDGARTDVVETGILRALQEPTDRWRPVVPPGVSVGHHHITAGTFGCLVRRDGELFMLSNNHVLADSNAARLGDPILQPGPADGGGPDDRVATLSEFVPLDFGTSESECDMVSAVTAGLNLLAGLLGSSHRVQAVKQSDGVNFVDAALAAPVSPDILSSEILNIGTPAGVGTATLGSQVQKSGRTTGHTTGVVNQVEATVRVDYIGRIALFQDQLVTSPMSEGGDSGSAILDNNRRVVGLLFAGSSAATIFNPIQHVLSALNVEIVT